MLDNIPVVAQKHPLSTRAQHKELSEGPTIAEIVAGFELDPRFGLPVVTLILGDQITEVPVSLWHRVRPKLGSRIEIGYRVHDPVTVGAIASAAISSAAPAIATSVFGLAAGTIGYGLAVAGITIVGGLIVNALIPPVEAPKQGRTNFAITGTSNQALKYAQYPIVLGRHRIFPPMSATGFSENRGKRTLYWRGRYALGWGPVALEDIRIGDDPITSFNNVEIEFLNVDQALTEAAIDFSGVTVVGWRTGTEPMTLYPDDVTEDRMQVRLEGVSEIVRQTRPNSVRGEVEISFPKGLYSRGKNTGDLNHFGKNFGLQYRLVGDSVWLDGVVSQELKAKQTSIVRFLMVADFPAAGTYELRIRRLSGESTASRRSDDSYVTAVRSVGGTGLPSHTNIAEIAVRIRATEQLNGTLDSLNCLVQQLAPVWDGSVWTAPQPVRHPAWIYARALTGPMTRRPVDAARIDAAALKLWADQEPHWTCDYVVDAETTVSEILNIICAAGRARRSLTDLKYSIIRETSGDPVRQVFTPRNSWGFRGQITFPREIHGLRMRVRSEGLGYEFDEFNVYADGYDANSATELETMELPGVTLPDGAPDQGNVWRLGRYHLAVALLRPETFEFYADFEHIVVTRGDRIQLVHDVPQAGIGAARVVAIDQTAGVINSITLDDDIDTAAGNYRVTIRTATGLRETFTGAAPVYKASRVWTRQSGTADGLAIAPGDLVAIEETAQETLEAIVTGIWPDTDDSARITAVPASPDVLLADSGPIPAYVPIVRNSESVFGPPKPVIIATYSGEPAAFVSRSGTMSPRIGVSVHSVRYPGGELKARLRWKNLSDPEFDGFEYSGELDPTETLYTNVLNEGDSYEIWVQFIAPSGKVSGYVLADASLLAESRDFTYPVPTGWTASPRMDSVILDGDPYNFEAFKEFLIYADDGIGGPEVLIGRAKDPYFVYFGDLVRFRVRAADTDDKVSDPTAWMLAAIQGVDIGDFNDDLDLRFRNLEHLEISVRWLDEQNSANGLSQLEQLLEIYNTRNTLKADIAYAWQDIRALVDDDRVAIASMRTELAAQIDANAADIISEQVARAAADGALASDITSLTATVGGHSASITTNASAIAGIDGKLLASITFRTKAGTGGAELELVSASDPSGGSVSTARITADNIILDGSVKAAHLNTATLGVAGIAIFGGSLESTNFNPGVDGWSIDNAGNAEFNSLTVRRDMLASGAVSDRNLIEDTTTAYTIAGTSGPYGTENDPSVEYEAHGVGDFDLMDTVSYVLSPDDNQVPEKLFIDPGVRAGMSYSYTTGAATTICWGVLYLAKVSGSVVGWTAVPLKRSRKVNGADVDVWAMGGETKIFLEKGTDFAAGDTIDFEFYSFRYRSTTDMELGMTCAGVRVDIQEFFR